MTKKIYLGSRDLSSATKIEKIGSDPLGSYACVRETTFHVQGGGQPADRGTINGKSVLGVRNVEGDIRHYVADLDGFAPGQDAILIVDAGWRQLCSLYHSAGHLISAIAEHAYPNAAATGGHHWPGEARVEFTGLDLHSDLLGVLSRGSNSVIWLNRSVTIEFGADRRRTCRIDGFAAVPCGGTHVEHTGELAGLKILKVKRKGSITRVSYAIESATPETG